MLVAVLLYTFHIIHIIWDNVPLYLTGAILSSSRAFLYQGELTISADMEELSNSLFLDSVPTSWAARAYPSLLGLSGWFTDLQQRIKELEGWSADFQLPTAVWLAGNDIAMFIRWRHLFA